ncbi:MAG TPA: DUF362 domain-containing protein, partial [Methanomassiliicoccales archaeon]|nr:DUF362 domain-containing protein [Methanomassiliicoccales archaeon]
MSDVFFSDLRASTEKDNIPNKITRLFRKGKMNTVYQEGDLVGFKTHFGEPGNVSFLRPQFLARMVDIVSKDGARPFLTDSNTLYVGSRSNAVDHLHTAVMHGFNYPVVNAPVVIADGLKGHDQVEVEVNQKRCRTVKIGSAVMEADSIICVSHFKGHMMTGFGGALKNLGMGCGSRAGKLDMHNGMRPKVDMDVCRGCGTCVAKCPAKAIGLKDRKAQVVISACIGCGECLVVCPYEAVMPDDWSNDQKALHEKMVEYCYGFMKGRRERFGFVTFIVDVSPDCDCAPWNDTAIVPNIGILMSKDIVAIDQAAADLVNASAGLGGSALKGDLSPGIDKWRGLHGLDWESQLQYAE